MSETTPWANLLKGSLHTLSFMGIDVSLRNKFIGGNTTDDLYYTVKDGGSLSNAK